MRRRVWSGGVHRVGSRGGGYSLQELVAAAAAEERIPVGERAVAAYLAQGLLPPPRVVGAQPLFEDAHLLRLRLLMRLTAQYVPLPEAGRWLAALDLAEMHAVLDRPLVPRAPSEGDAQVYLARMLASIARGATPPPQLPSLAAPRHRSRRGGRVAPLPAPALAGRSEWLHISVDQDVQLIVRSGSARITPAAIERMTVALQRCLGDDPDAE